MSYSLTFTLSGNVNSFKSLKNFAFKMLVQQTVNLRKTRTFSPLIYRQPWLYIESAKRFVVYSLDHFQGFCNYWKAFYHSDFGQNGTILAACKVEENYSCSKLTDLNKQLILKMQNIRITALGKMGHGSIYLYQICLCYDSMCQNLVNLSTRWFWNYANGPVVPEWLSHDQLWPS